MFSGTLIRVKGEVEMKEACCLVDHNSEILYWHLPLNRTSVSLPDSTSLWDKIWEHRRVLTVIAHTHPGRGWPAPSQEDITTFAGVEAGLGHRILWIISSTDKSVLVQWKGPEKYDYESIELLLEPRWVSMLRSRSDIS